MTTPVFSIITPMWKGAALVGATIDFVLAQTFTDWEMIIVDDCSPDDGAGAAVVQSYVEKDSRIKLIRATENRGSSGARNQAMEAAKGQYFAFLDRMTKYLATMKRHIDECSDESVAIFFSGYRRMDSTCSKVVLPDYACSGKKDFKKLLYHCPIFPSAAIVDTAKLKSPVFFREELKALRDDYVYWLDIMKQELCCLGNNDILVDYRMRDDSMTASKTKMIISQWMIYREILHFNILKSSFYLFSWGMNGLKKYRKL
ncbi:MAG: glycosyltransferase [Treponema sp.]|nr:glycosyltransferase [Treponema sp.]